MQLPETICALPLRGAGGEPISFARTIYSHGCALLPPATVEEEPLVYRRTIRVGDKTVEIALRECNGDVVAQGARRLSLSERRRVGSIVARMFRLNDDLSPFYAKAEQDERLRWSVVGAGRILASPTVFEDVVKTVCTTNCAWSATVRMTTALVELGGGAFPEAETLARASDDWYRIEARMGYRGPYVKQIARDVASGRLDLESLLAHAGRTDEEVEKMLLSLPGIGPYAAAHVMQMLGRHRRLVLDSWTRPKFVRLARKQRASDATIRRAFSRYGEHAGLAFWLYLTRDWLEDERANEPSRR
ncbi:MAG: Fe-S cluster assembly protein HesB [Candidatus Eremiobacteraeota bacterium]|nr:Fe-S cluster assembly protein HesB [Candidatus Eremiobacteraeota bacterium]